MRLVAVCVVLAAAPVPGVVANDLFCDCRLEDHHDWKYALHCTSQQVESSVVHCEKSHPVSHLPWTPNEPNNGNGDGEDCVNVRNDGLLNDAKCGAPEPFLCERRLTVGVPDTYTWSEEAGRFYKVHTEKKVHAEAATECRSENATLAVPDTWLRALALMRLVEPKFDGYLVGLTDEAVEGDFVTETGRHLKDMEFQAWGVNQPDNNDHGKPENCLSLQGIGALNDVRCDSELPFFCEIVPV